MDEQVKTKTTDNPDPFTNEFSRQIWEVTYKTQNENSITDTWKRVASAVANVEKDDESKRFYAEAFYEILKDFKFIPGGRILANAGGSCKNVSLVNCFCKGARVLTDHGYVPIENVVKGDLVLTHKGNWKPVVNTLKRNYKGDLVVFNDSMLSDELHATVEHPFLDSSGAWVPASQVKEVVFPKNSNLKEYITIDLYDYFKNLPKGIILYDTTKIWTKSSFVGGNGAQGVKESETIDRHIKVTEEFAYILGRFAGDGSSFTAPQNKNNYFSKHAFNICFSKKEVTSLTYCKKILEETFKFKVHINGQPTRNFQYLRKFNFIVATFLHKIIGDKSYNKRIPTCIWKSPKSVQFAFLCGFVGADGCVTQKGTICVTLKNKTLVQELQSLCSMVGIFSRLSPKKLYGKMSKYQTDQYVGLYINKKFSQILLPYLKKIYADNRLNSSFCEKACSSKTSCNCMPISTKIIAYEGEVYNLSVQDDESYIVNNIVTHNCYLSPAPKYDMDSIEGIMEVLKNQVLTLKSEGGWGLNCSFIRPRGSYIEGIGARTPGAVKYLELFDKSSEIITEGPGEYYIESKEKTPKNEKKKIRKGAMMLCLSCWHPDIYEFITAKQKPFHLTKMNMSVNVTNAFMDILNRVNELVKNNASQEEIDAVDFWQLRFPDTAFEKYKSEWDGDLDKWEKKGYPVKVYRTVRATDLWEALMQSTSNRSEPGVLFLDRANETHCANYIPELQLVGTNPCLTGDTKVAVADGRTNVTIKELAEAGRDVPVLACDNSGSIVTKLMRNPRITGYNKDIYRVTLDDGNHIDCTSNHKFRLSDGTYKEVKDLSIGVALHTNTLSVEEYKRYLVQEVLNTEITPNLQRDSVQQLCEEAKSQGYEVKIDNDIVLVKRVCEECGKEHFVPFTHREIAFCSLECLNTHLNKEKIAAKTTNTDSNIISAEDWPVRFVSSIEHIGKQDVYTGTVDDVHNYCVGMFETVNEQGHPKFYMLNNQQCGEQVLYSGGCCNLGSINLTAFIEYDETKHAAVFNFQKFYDIIPYCVRFLDNVIDIANLPLEEYKYMAENYRRIGLGITGIGSALMMLGLKYDSKEAKDFLTKVFDVYNFLGIRASIALAKCKGAFKGCNPAKHADNIKYTFRHLPKYILDALQKELLETNGIRNSALFSVQPTGNTGCLANNISGGVEPVFQLEYYRIVGVPIVPESIKDKCPRFWEGDFTPNNYFKEVKYADFTYLSYVTETGQEYQIHKDRGLCEKVKIRDYAYQWILDHNLEYPQEVFTTAMQLPVESHLEILKLVSAHLDSAVSKTINVGKDYPYEQFKNVYLDAYNSGVIKGVTTYREGSMSAVLQTADSKDDVNPTSTSIIHPTITAEKRPDILPCRVFFRTVKGISYYFIVSFLENSPFEMFIDINEDNIFDEDGEWVERRRIIPKTVKEGTLKKLGKATFEFVSKDEKFIYKIVKANESSDKATLTALARLVALNLQSGVSVKEIIHQLSKTEGDFTSIVKAINKVLSQCAGKVDLGETCPVCGGKVLREEGCKKCYACGWSACG
jgi:ribonucleotide reductase alpha subunit